MIILSGSGGGRPPLLAPTEEPTLGDPVGVSLGLYASPLTELRADPALGVPEREPESVRDCACAPLVPPPGIGRDPEETLLVVSGLLDAPADCGFFLATAEALWSSFLSVSGVDDLVGDSSEGMEARLDSLLCAWRALLFFLGVSGVEEREEME